jgi:DNA-binding response OmpR family regulator
VFVLNMLKDFFGMRGYEVLTYAYPMTVCPLIDSGDGECGYDRPCCDVMIVDFNMTGMNGVEFIERQIERRCRVDVRNKAVIADFIDESRRTAVDAMGCTFFQKPFDLLSLSEWLSACEQRIDLSQPLASRRHEERYDSYREITFRVPRTNEVITGIALNISPSGLCLKAPGPLVRQDRITIDAGHFPTCKQASVCWVRKIDDASFLAGLQCG